MSAEGTRIRILVVDDDRDFRKVLSKFLEKQGYEVETAEDGQVALQRETKEEFDLILCDLRMPNMNGMQFVEEMKKQKRNTGKIIIVTAYAEVESYMDLMNLGVFEFIDKPVKDVVIIRLVKEALKQVALKEFQTVLTLLEMPSPHIYRSGHYPPSELAKRLKKALTKVSDLGLTDDLPAEQQQLIEKCLEPKSSEKSKK